MSESPRDPIQVQFELELKQMFEQFRKEQEMEDAEERRNSIGGVPWNEAPLPPRMHKCWAQTTGWIGFEQVQRCACGALRNPRFGGGWLDKNSSRKDEPAEPTGLRGLWARLKTGRAA